MSKKF